MGTPNKESLKEFAIRTVKFKGYKLGKEKQKTMTHSTLSKWLPRFGYMILLRQW